jgi:hypothetical protein
MGFSLVGNSGSSSTTSNVYETSYSASLNPQFDQAGSGAGSAAIDVAPLLQGSSFDTLSPNIADYYAPLNILTTGAITGDSAIAGLQALAAAQTNASEAGGSSTPTSTSTSALSSLFSGSNIYWVLAGLVLLFLAWRK